MKDKFNKLVGMVYTNCTPISESAARDMQNFESQGGIGSYIYER